MTLFVPLTPLQRFWYQRLLTKVDTGTFNEIFKKSNSGVKAESSDGAVGTSPDGQADESQDMQVIRESVQRTVEDTKKGKAQWQSLMSLLMQLRKICNHPVSYLNPLNPWALGSSPSVAVFSPRRCAGPLRDRRASRHGFWQIAAS